MDPSIRRVLEAFAASPASVAILWTTYHMEREEAEAALHQAIEEGYVEDVGPIAFGLTPDGVKALASAAGIQGYTAAQFQEAGTRAEQEKNGPVEGDHIGAPRRFGRGDR